jgi:type I restriction enzyme S subunit
MIEEVNLADVCDIIAGQSPPSSTYNQEGNGVPFFQGKADFGETYPTVRYWCNSPKKMSKPDDILFSVRAPVGPTNINNINACIGRGLAAIRCSNIQRNYLLHYLRGNEDKIASLGTGSTFKAITIGTLKKLKIPLPPIDQQKKIAAILDAADAYRQKTKALITKYEELTQSLFLDMFGDPVRNPMGWEVKNLKDLTSKIHSGNTPKGGSKVYVNEGITFFRSQNVWKNNIVLDGVAYIDDGTHKSMMKSSLRHKDILMTKTGRINTENSSLGRAAMYLGADDRANVNGHVYLIRLNEGVNNEFVLHILTSKEYRGHIRSVCVGGIDKRQLNKGHIEDFPIISPPKEMQEKFIENLLIIRDHKDKLKLSLAQSEDLFNSLLQKAFKGELS